MLTTDGALDLTKTFLHLSDGPDVTELPVTDDFFEQLATRGDLGDGRMISMFHFTESWDSWEMHPAGEEVVCLLNGAADMHLEEARGERVIKLRGRGAVVVPRGIWHTTTIHQPSDMMFITRGAGTEHRPR